MGKITKTDKARRLPFICAHASCYLEESGEVLTFVLDEQFQFIPMSERLHNCLASAGIVSIFDLRFFIRKHGVKPLLKVKNFGKVCLREVEEMLTHRLSGPIEITDPHTITLLQSTVLAEI